MMGENERERMTIIAGFAATVGCICLAISHFAPSSFVLEAIPGLVGIAGVGASIVISAVLVTEWVDEGSKIDKEKKKRSST